jgi:hypothetical protein
MNTTSTTLNPGDRIRLVVLNVDIDGHEERVTRRYDWTGTDPVHMCNADVCETCAGGAIRTATRRIGAGAGKANAAVTLLRDGQSVAR